MLPCLYMGNGTKRYMHKIGGGLSQNKLLPYRSVRKCEGIYRSESNVMAAGKDQNVVSDVVVQLACLFLTTM